MTTSKTLRSLTTDAFLHAALPVSTGEGLAAFLRAAHEVKDLRRTLETGETTVEEVRAFVQEVLRGLRVGEKFVEEIALAAIAIALESLPGGFGSGFADEYLRNLAGLRIAEIPLAPRVAALAVAKRDKALIPVTVSQRVIRTMTPVTASVAPIDSGATDDRFSPAA